MNNIDITPSNRQNPWSQITQQIIDLSNRIAALEAIIKTLSANKANPGVPVSTFAAAPPAVTGDIRFFTDKTFPAASLPGVLAVYDGTRWLALGEDVSLM